MRRSRLLWLEGTAVHKKGEKKTGKLKGSGCKSGPAPHYSEKHHNRLALAAACVPCRQAEKKGVAESESSLQRDCCVAMATVFALNR